MEYRKKSSISAMLYTMVYRWKMLLLLFVIGLAIGTGFIMIRGKKTTSSDAASSPAATVTVDDRSRATTEGYEAYLNNSAYMNLDPNNLHVHYVHYNINWKETGLDPQVYESKNASLFQWIYLYYPSDDFIRNVIALKEEYKDRALHEVIGVTRSGSVIIFTVVYSNDYYVKDVCNVIDSTLKAKIPEWYSIAGEFDLVKGPETDTTIDGVSGGYKSVQDSKRNTLAQFKAAEANNVSNTAAAKQETKEMSMPVKVLSVIFIALVWCFVAGGIMALYDRHFNSVREVVDYTGKDVLCIIKGDRESGLNRLFYKNNEMYHKPELFLSIMKKNIKDAGIKTIYLIKCADYDMTDVCSKLTEALDGIKTVCVSDDSRQDFFLHLNEDESVIMILKGGVSLKSEHTKMMKYFTNVGVKCEGVVFVA